MAYSKQTWNDDDSDTPLSAERLNHMEDGIEAAGGLPANWTINDDNTIWGPNNGNSTLSMTEDSGDITLYGTSGFALLHADETASHLWVQAAEGQTNPLLHLHDENGDVVFQIDPDGTMTPPPGGGGLTTQTFVMPSDQGLAADSWSIFGYETDLAVGTYLVHAQMEVEAASGCTAIEVSLRPSSAGTVTFTGARGADTAITAGQRKHLSISCIAEVTAPCGIDYQTWCTGGGGSLRRNTLHANTICSAMTVTKIA